MKMPSFKMPKWAVNAGGVLMVLGVIVGALVAIAGVIATVFAFVISKILIGAALRASVLWLIWTYFGFGLWFTSLPPHLQQIDFLPIFYGAAIWQFIVISFLAPFRRARNPFGSSHNLSATEARVLSRLRLRKSAV